MLIEARAAADAVNTRADAIERASKRLVYEVTLSEDKGGLQVRQGGDARRGEGRHRSARAAAEGGAERCLHRNRRAHRQRRRRKDLNYKLGLERAEAVKRYLYEQHQVPLHKISVISYGEEKPIAPNKTKAGRAQNRRVVIKVLT